ncbi:hypothetical protein XA68_14226 [Ophiocordyceps unilateralis]|uniref:Uncharacterized protein n=1 Tax=Ophiocordyceps unilateralis TaxID=268505 RepID=A0A2A9PB65_OPHUN|nr:hypothetical protein XA68_14226 [Ophiocordyceps unilateralis]
MKATIVPWTILISFGLAAPAINAGGKGFEVGVEAIGKLLGGTGEDIAKAAKEFNDADPNPNFFTAEGGGTQIV